MNSSLILALLLMFVSCSKKSDFFKKETPVPAPENIKAEVPSVENLPIEELMPADEKRHTDTFQKTNKELPIDIVFVIDNSGSMSDKQEELAQNFSLFINDFITNRSDFKIAITNTDWRPDQWCRVGNLCGGRAVPGSLENLSSKKAQDDEVNFIENFKKMSQVGINGVSEPERGLETAKQFLDRHADFLRKEAHLAIIVIADEDDGFTNSQNQNKAVKDYVKAYQSVKSNPGLVKVHSIVTQSKRKSNESVGTRYMQASQLTHGLIGNIHDHFSDLLLKVGANLHLITKSFPLSQKPSSRVSVSVNGDKLTESDFKYNLDTNTVELLKDFTHQSTIEVSYNVAE